MPLESVERCGYVVTSAIPADLSADATSPPSGGTVSHAVALHQAAGSIAVRRTAIPRLFQPIGAPCAFKQDPTVSCHGGSRIFW